MDSSGRVSGCMGVKTEGRGRGRDMRGWGLGRASWAEEKDCPPGWWKAWPPVSLALVSWRAGEARGCQGETLASGRHSDQIRAR